MPTPEFPRRDGSIVHDPRLGRLVSPESEQQRCMAYPLRTEQRGAGPIKTTVTPASQRKNK